jgi:hypothetical protein
MAVCRGIINRALRKLGRLGAGREARPSDAEDALEALKGMYKAWIISGAFGRLSDVVPTGDYVAGENQRIFRNSEATVSITLPELVPAYADPLPYNRERDNYTNYAEIDGNNRPPRDGSVVVVANAIDGSTVSFVYDGSIRQWQEIDGLTLDSEAPRSYGDPEGLSATLALEVADEYGVQLGAATMRQARRYEQAMTARYSTPTTVSVASYM